MNNIELETILNIKEILGLKNINENADMPQDIFNIICDEIIKEIMNASKLNYTDFSRDAFKVYKNKCKKKKIK